MALRRREQAADPEYRMSPAIGEFAVLATVPALEHRVAELERENAALRAENDVLRSRAYGDLPCDPNGTTSAKGGW